MCLTGMCFPFSIADLCRWIRLRICVSFHPKAFHLDAIHVSDGIPSLGGISLHKDPEGLLRIFDGKLYWVEELQSES